MSRPRGNGQESGFAMLLVFVLAAGIAIALYYELPRAMFEHTREKEQLLIDRGEQYSLAVRRFYVKFGRWPAKMDDLENTNNIRFLRRQYKDPMTGEADWRIIHETAGVLTDSLVHPATQPTQSQNGASGTSGTGQTFGTLTGSLPFGSSLASPSSSENPDQPAPLAFGLLPRPSDRGPLGNAHGGISSDDTTPPSTYDAGAPNPNPPPTDAANQPPAAQDPNAAANPSASQVAGAGGAAQPGTPPGSVADMINNQLRGPRQMPGITSGQQSTGVTGGGIGIAGVASTSELRGIKIYNDRRKYKEWEFVFDMSKLQQLQGGQQPQQAQQLGGQPGAPPQPTPTPTPVPTGTP